LKLII